MSTPIDSVSSNRTANVSGTLPRPPWLDEQLYPFQSRFVEVEGNRIHCFPGILSGDTQEKRQQKFSAQEMKAYRGPMVNRAVRRHPHDLFQSAANSDDYLVDLEKRLQFLKGMPALLIFSDADSIVKMGWLQRMEQLFPEHRSIVLQGSHHFPQEYDPASVVTAIRSWLDETIAL